MAIAFIADNATPTYATRTNTTITRPAGSDGTSLKIAMITTDSVAVTTNANWTAFTNSPFTYSGAIRMWFYWTFHDAATWSFTHSSNGSNGYCAAFSGVDTTTPIDVQPVTNSGAASGTAVGSSITTITDNAMLFLLYADNEGGNSTSTPTGMTEAEDGAADAKAFFYQLLGAAGSTGTRSSTLGTTTNWGTAMGALRPTVAAVTFRGLTLVGAGV